MGYKLLKPDMKMVDCPCAQFSKSGLGSSLSKLIDPP